MLLHSRLCIFCVHQVHIRCKCLINTLLYYITAKCIVKYWNHGSPQSFPVLNGWDSGIMAVHSLSQSSMDGTVESWQSTVFPSPQPMGQWNHGSPLSPSQSFPVLNGWDNGIMAVHSLSQSSTDGTVESWQSTVCPSPQQMGQWNHGSPHSLSQSSTDGTVESRQSIHTVFPSPQSMRQWNHGSPQSVPVLNRWYS